MALGLEMKMVEERKDKEEAIFAVEEQSVKLWIGR